MTIDEAMNMARQHHQADRLGEAETLYRQVLGVMPNHAAALHLLGVIAGQVGKPDIAIELIGKSAEISPDSSQVFNDLSVFLKDAGRTEEAIAASKRAIQIDPNSAMAHSNLSAALIDRGEFTEAIIAAHRAINLAPGFADALVNLASACRAIGRYFDAIQALKQAVTLRPNHAESHWNLGWLLLLTGDFNRGWVEYEWRAKLKDAPARAMRKFAQPRWDGTDLTSKTILLYADQGLGDTLQFLRYVRTVTARGGRVIVECQRELKRLLLDYPGTAQVLAEDEPLPKFDVQCALTSLGTVFGTDLESIPQMIPPLQADANLIKMWIRRIGPAKDRLRVGLAWSGGSRLKTHLRRNIGLKKLQRLGSAKQVEFFSLQKGPGADQSTAMQDMPIVDHMPEVQDMADTAALVAQLDLVITVDTSVAHLAGAMGKPTFLMLPAQADWRWLLDRDDSPWYPSMRLFRQRIAGDWDEVVDHVLESLKQIADNVAGRKLTFFPGDIYVIHA